LNCYKDKGFGCTEFDFQRLAFLFTGKNLPNANGIAFVYSGSATSGWALGQRVNKPGSNYSGLFDQKIILIALESGHKYCHYFRTETLARYMQEMLAHKIIF